jgi:hypothetical protein
MSQKAWSPGIYLGCASETAEGCYIVQLGSRYRTIEGSPSPWNQRVLMFGHVGMLAPSKVLFTE